jgi:hypothetical protein
VTPGTATITSIRVVEFGAGLPLQGLRAVLSAAPAPASGTHSHRTTVSTEALSTDMSNRSDSGEPGLLLQFSPVPPFRAAFGPQHSHLPGSSSLIRSRY